MIKNEGARSGGRRRAQCIELGEGRNTDADNDRLSGNGEPGRARVLAVRPWRDGAAAMGGQGRGRRGRRGAARGDELFVEEDARVVYLLLILLLVLSDSELRRREHIDLGLPAQLSQLDVQLPRARAYERRDGDAPAPPRAAYPGARGRLAAAMHHPYRALPERVRVLVYALSINIERGVSGGGRDERVRAVGAGVAGGVREGAGGGEGGGGGRGRGVRGAGRAGTLGRVGVGVGRGRRGARGAGECERAGGGALVLRREGEVRPEQRRVDAGRGLGRRGSGNWKGEPPPPHDERRGALLELAEHQAHAGGAGGGVQVLHGLFALQGGVAGRCAEGERERRGGGVGVEGGGDEGAELGEAEGREAGGRHRRRLGRRGGVHVEGKDEEGK
ncbi:hypothetical protein B0H14DRAFT_3155253 [Mycena olivaceomarginata]|nr:hypothetical protein B0H14DRAFT_3155253 [Mycena olivaceomarginata]